ncbi:uncharacterized protein LOC132559268 [Ylistrum balloti]|uniref:uncharacterized protein LOC132559268 n=1 Tax=Ylistrum balloti TaxID=509963 RepID=UPI002905F2D4|nr:uncharacterized protein LOC132559268 [Ylistrum balloti]
MDAAQSAYVTLKTSSETCQSGNDLGSNTVGCTIENKVREWFKTTGIKDSTPNRIHHNGNADIISTSNGLLRCLKETKEEKTEHDANHFTAIDRTRGSRICDMSGQSSNLSSNVYSDCTFSSAGLTVMDRVKAIQEGYSIISESDEAEVASSIPEGTKTDTEILTKGIEPFRVRRKTFAVLDNLPFDIKETVDDEDKCPRMTLRRNSVMCFNRKKESRDSVESIDSRRTSIVSSRKGSSERKPVGPSLRRASFAVPQFLRRENSFSECQFYRRTSHDVTIPETTKDRNGILTVLKDTSSQWKKVKIKLDLPVQEVRNGSKAVRFTYLEDVQTALQILLGTRETVAILKSRNQPDILTSSDEYGKGAEKSKVDDTKYLVAENEKAQDSMSPQDKLPVSNNNGVRRKSISDVISTMKAESNNYQSQIQACVDLERFADDDDIEVLMKKQEAISFMVEAMSKFMDKTELHLAACKTLVALSTNSVASCIQMCRENGISTLLRVIRTHEDHTHILTSVLEILGNISLTEELSEEIVKNAGHSEILAKMSCQRDDYNVAKLCCFILGNLVNTVDVAQSIMFVGGVHSIIEALRRFPTNAEVLENGCRALGCFSAHDEICMDVVNAGAVEAVLVAMAAAPEVDTLQECGCWALACLTKFEESCLDICKNNGIDTILMTLERFRKEEALQEYGCWTISNLSANEQTLTHIINHRVLTVVTDAMCQFPDNLEIQHQIFFAIGQIVMTSGEMQEKLVRSGGVRSAVNIMTSFPDSQELQEHGCRILGNVAVNEQLRKLIENDGGSKAVISAMLTHDRHEQIQTYGCMALTNITADVLENKTKVAANSGVSAVLATIKEMTALTDIVLCGLKTLCNLMGGDDASYYFMEDEGLEAMESIIYRYRKHHDIHRYACRILANVPLAPGIDETCLDATEDILYETLNRFHGDSDLHISVCHYYENLVLTDTGRSRFTKGNYLDRLADVMTFFKDDKTIQMSGCKTIAAISMYKNSSVQNGELCVSLVLDVMRIFHACSSIQTVCCGAISYLTEHNENLKDYILRKGGLDVMMANLREHPDDEGLAVVGLMALDSITHTGITNSNRLQKEIEFVSRMMKRYPENVELQIYSCNILSAVGKEGIRLCDLSRSEALDPVTCILKRRRSHPELESTALEVLTMLLSGESEDIIRDTREMLPFLDDEFWEKCYHNVLHID